MALGPKRPDRPLRVGDRVTVEGCHANWRPFIVEIKGKVAVLETAVTGGRYEKPLAHCRLAGHPPTKRGLR